MENPELARPEYSYFSSCDKQVKLEIFKNILDLQTVVAASLVCKEWSKLLSHNRVWHPLFDLDFADWHHDKQDSTPFFKDGTYWKDKYIDYYIKGWQWDSQHKHSKIDMSNNNFTASLSVGRTYHGIRTVQPVKPHGTSYFEVTIEPSEDREEENIAFDKGTNIFMGIGIANDTFEPENCTTGWTRRNSGVGYYNDGQVYAFGDRHYDNYNKSRKIEIKTSDRLGIEVTMVPGNDQQSTVTFYLNGKQVTTAIPGLNGLIYPYLILAKDIKLKVSIVSGFKGYPRLLPSKASAIRGVFVLRMKVNFAVSQTDKLRIYQIVEKCGAQVFENYEVLMEFSDNICLFYKGSSEPSILIEVKTSALNAYPSADCSRLVSLLWFSGIKDILNVHWNRVVWCESHLEEGPVRMWTKEPVTNNLKSIA